MEKRRLANQLFRWVDTSRSQRLSFSICRANALHQREVGRFLYTGSYFIALIALILEEFYKFKGNPKSIFLLLSPAFAFMFWVNDPAVAFRKEVFIYLDLVFALKAFLK